ncbi:VCBS repeat-containing protein [Nocardiopsis sp. EMB25]|uniref:FG-GAP repeat domain-containing protein n=1 Tax=Nocardiopsis sp. EMB25 TaxID=2835867 RepID=UPI002283BCD4|nr:VCBS repeat-containing protein [Nocardiopsis sp. EMB25]MCY9783578.1 VCBS repeat-containing protein [Nocardiopsis sp. EMB25]
MPPAPRARVRATAAVLALTVAGCGAPDEEAPPEERPSPGPSRLSRVDFDGDGFDDLVLGLPGAEVDGRPNAGVVAVVPGSADGPDLSSARVISRADEGVPGAVAEDDRFGGRTWLSPGTLTGDLDGDGFTDLVVNAGDQGAGERGPILLWGSAEGLGAGVPLGADVPSGYVDAVGDFDGDGYPDLVRLDPNADMGAGGFGLLYGPFSREWEPDRVGDVPSGQGGDELRLTSGDVNGDGVTDLIGFASFEEMAHPTRVWLGSADGFEEYEGAEPLPTADQGTVADVNGDGYGDLVLRDIGGSVENPPYIPGEVVVVYGSESGPGERSTPLNLDSEGVPGASFDGDQFAHELAAGDVDGDGYTDVVAAVMRPASDAPFDAGDVVVLRGGPEGLSGDGALRYGAEEAGAPVPPPAEMDRFDHYRWPGTRIRALDADGDGLADVIVRPSPAGTGPDAGAPGSLWMFHGDGEPTGGLDLTGLPIPTGD